MLHTENIAAGSSLFYFFFLFYLFFNKNQGDEAVLKNTFNLKIKKDKTKAQRNFCCHAKVLQLCSPESSMVHKPLLVGIWKTLQTHIMTIRYRRLLVSFMLP